MSKIKGILIDSGRVLNISKTGNWSYSPNFFKIVGEEKFNKVSKDSRKKAFKDAWSYINSINTILTIDDEYKHLFEFFNILSKNLPELEIDYNKKKLLTDDIVKNFDKYIFFDDVFEVIPRLKKKYKLCIVSDAWPSLREVYKKAGLYDYFDYMIISSEQGIRKPNEKMYTRALNEIGLKESDVIFIDDNPTNCNKAKELGIESIILERQLIRRLHSKFILKSKHKIIKNLYKLENILNKV